MTNANVAQPLINAQVLFDRADAHRRFAAKQTFQWNRDAALRRAADCERDARAELDRARMAV